MTDRQTKESKKITSLTEVIIRPVLLAIVQCILQNKILHNVSSGQYIISCQTEADPVGVNQCSEKFRYCFEFLPKIGWRGTLFLATILYILGSFVIYVSNSFLLNLQWMVNSVNVQYSQFYYRYSICFKYFIETFAICFIPETKNLCIRPLGSCKPLNWVN